MVDRIAPAFDKTIPNLIKDEFKIDDHWPVVTEPYRKWVVEDNFTLGETRVSVLITCLSVINAVIYVSVYYNKDH